MFSSQISMFIHVSNTELPFRLMKLNNNWWLLHLLTQKCLLSPFLSAVILSADLPKRIPIANGKAMSSTLGWFPDSNVYNHFYLPTAILSPSNPTCTPHMCILTYWEIKWNENFSVDTGQISGTQPAIEVLADTMWEIQSAAMYEDR